MEYIFDSLDGVASSVERETISLVISNSNDQKALVNLSIAIVPTIISALIAEGGKLAKTLPAHRRDHYRPIQPSKVTASIMDNQACLLFEFESGLGLPLVMDIRDIAGLSAQLDRMTGASDDSVN